MREIGSNISILTANVIRLKPPLKDRLSDWNTTKIASAGLLFNIALEITVNIVIQKIDKLHALRTGKEETQLILFTQKYFSNL